MAAYGVLSHRGAIAHTLSQLRQSRPDWIAAAVAAEIVSLAAYALIVRYLLRLGDVRARLLPLLGSTVVGIAILNSLPGGQALSSVYWYKQLRRYGASRRLGTIVLFAAGGIGVVTLVYLTVFGVLINGRHGFLGPARTPILVGALLVLAVRFLFHRQLAAAFRWLVRRVAGSEEPIVNRRVPARVFAGLMGLGYVNWVLDCVALLTALIAVHASVPWQGVLIAYAFGQLAASLPLLPGGGGTVEASLVLGLIAYGGTHGGIVAGVIVFRLVSAWALVPVGWLIWALTPHDALRAEIAA